MQHNQNQFNGISPMTQQLMMAQRMGMGNIRDSFATPTNLIDRPDFVNHGNVMHNNMGPNLLSEHVMEYKIHISSSDRNTSTYPSPFKMKATFGLAKTSQAPLIAKKFKNIKYITLDSIILPRTVGIDTSQMAYDTLYPTDSGYPDTAPAAANSKLNKLSNHRYLVVKIDELASEKNVGTSNLFDRDTFTFIYDTDLGLDNCLWKPLHNNRVIYQNAMLCNISTLTLTLLDEYGEIVKLVDEDGDDIVYSEYVAFINDNESETSVSYTNGVTQVTYNFTFGVIENELNTLTSY